MFFTKNYMKRILPLLAALVAAPVLAAPPVRESDLPGAFKNEPPYVQNQVCGELMASMSRLSADLYAATGTPGTKTAAIMSGTRALIFIKATANLTKEEALRAKRIAEQLEQKASVDKPAILTMVFCEERAKRWLAEGVVTPADFQVTEKDVRTALDQAVKPPVKR